MTREEYLSSLSTQDINNIIKNINDGESTYDNPEIMKRWLMDELSARENDTSMLVTGDKDNYNENKIEYKNMILPIVVILISVYILYKINK